MQMQITVSHYVSPTIRGFNCFYLYLKCYWQSDGNKHTEIKRYAESFHSGVRYFPEPTNKLTNCRKGREKV